MKNKKASINDKVNLYIAISSLVVLVLLTIAIATNDSVNCKSNNYKEVETKRFTGKYWVTSSKLVCNDQLRGK